MSRAEQYGIRAKEREDSQVSKSQMVRFFRRLCARIWFFFHDVSAFVRLVVGDKERISWFNAGRNSNFQIPKMSQIILKFYNCLSEYYMDDAISFQECMVWSYYNTKMLLVLLTVRRICETYCAVVPHCKFGFVESILSKSSGQVVAQTAELCPSVLSSDLKGPTYIRGRCATSSNRNPPSSF